MKIYTKIILDKNDNLISEEFFDYEGKIAFAGIHYDYKSTRSAKLMEKQAKREKKLAERRAKKLAKDGEKKNEDDERTGVLLQLMEGNIKESRNNRESLKKVLEEQTERLTSALDKSTAALNRSTTLKALVRLDLTEFDHDFQKKAKKKLEEELGPLLGFKKAS